MLYQVMSVDVIVGLQRGDEGKGRFVDLEAEKYDVVARGNGGANAGHTIAVEGMDPLALHQIPSGIAYSDKVNIIGNGVYVDPRRLQDEINDARQAGISVEPNKLLVSNIAHLVMPHHVRLDCLREEGTGSQGSTKAGIAFVAADKYLREGIRTEDILSLNQQQLRSLALDGLISIFPKIRTNKDVKSITQEFGEEAEEWAQSCEELKPYLADTVDVIREFLNDDKRVLAEGAQAYWLDVNHGMYPYVTSSSTTVNGLMDGLGLSHKDIGGVTGVAKMVRSHVGGGPFVTRIADQALTKILRGEKGEVDSEHGATTGREREVGYPDFVELRNALDGNGVDKLVLSKMDCVHKFGKTVLVATEYNFDGKKLNRAPSSAKDLATCTPIYTEMKTWGKEITEAKSWLDLPEPAKDFIMLAEQTLSIQTSMIGVGPERNQVIEL